MELLLWAERRKLRRSKILWLAGFATVMVALIVFAQGQFTFYESRYIDGAGSVSYTHLDVYKRQPEERALIQALFFDERKESELAMELGISQPAVYKRKTKILKKLKLLLEG